MNDLFGNSQKRIDSLIQTAPMVSTDTGKEFYLMKCGVLILKRGKQGKM